MTDEGAGRSLALTVLTLGFLAVAGAVLTATRSPATGYEVSIYSATPVTFWIACSVAFLAAISVAVSPLYEDVAPFVLVLGGSTMLTIAALPVLRGYYFYGLGDSLTHLGWARQLAAGSDPLAFFYPGSHLIAAAIAALGYEMPYAMLLSVVLFTLLYLVCVPLLVWTIVGERRGLILGGFAGLLLLPIFNLGTSFMFVPFTLGLLFTPLVLVFFCRSFLGPVHPDDTRPRSQFLLALTGITLLFVHSQVLLDVLILLGTALVMQILARMFWSDSPIASHPLLAGPVLFLGSLFTVWNVNHHKMFSMINGLVHELTTGGQAGAIVQERSGSLQDVGGSIVEMFAKLFLVHALFSIVAGVLVLAVLLGTTHRLSTRERSVTLYFGIGGIVLVPFFLIHFVGSVSSFFFRHVGFGMVIVTVLGTLGFVSLSRRFPRRTGPLLGAGAGIAIALSVAILFPS